MTQRAFSGVLDNNTEQRIACLGQFIYMRSASSQLLVSADSIRNNEGGKILAQRIPLTARQLFRVNPEQYDNVIVRNESGGQVQYELIAGFGDYQAPLAEVSLDVPSLFTSGADVTANAAGVSLIAARAARKRAIVTVDEAATLPVTCAGSQADAVANLGVQMQPGMTYFFETTAQLWVARDGAVDQLVHVAEEIYA